MERPKSPIRHCAIYTRKSSEEGLEQASMERLWTTGGFR
jgi:hypothetical protein